MFSGFVTRNSESVWCFPSLAIPSPDLIESLNPVQDLNCTHVQFCTSVCTFFVHLYVNIYINCADLGWPWYKDDIVERD